jgi:AraC-like DNA-binding protein
MHAAGARHNGSVAERLFVRLQGDPVYAPETGVPPGTMRELAVPAALQAHVAHMLRYEEAIPEGEERIERVLPDGAVHLILELGDGAAQPVLRVAGASAAPVVLRIRGHIRGLSATLQPGAAAAVLGLPAAELTGLALPLDMLWRDGAQLAAQLHEAPTDATRARLLLHCLHRRLAAHQATGSALARQAAAMISRSGGSLLLRDVARAIGTGERRLQQLFQQHVGLAPRTYGRLARMHQCLRLLRSLHAPRWTELALEAGYYDQAHLANEFQALCGLSPTAFLGQARISGSSKTTA